MEGEFLYGTATYGGANENGVLFKIKKDGSNYTKLIDFDDAQYGSGPYGTLVSDGTFLYGTTIGGGSSDLGTIYRYKHN